MTRRVHSYPAQGHVPWPAAEVREVPYERPASRQVITYTCDRGHVFTVVFAAGPGVIVPDGWLCRCGAAAGQADPRPRQSEHDRCMVQVRKRRSDAELEEMLAEAIAARRAGLAREAACEPG